MILDSSAIVGLLIREPQFETVEKKIEAAVEIGVGTPTLTETGIVLAAKIGKPARSMLTRFLDELNVAEIPFGERHWREALVAYERFGRGRHSASLNFGDCMAYATAKLAKRPLLCLGNDFPKTDLLLA